MKPELYEVPARLITHMQGLKASAQPPPPPVATQQHFDVMARAEAYLQTMEPSISGSGGHDACYRAACKMVIGFNLTPEQAFQLLSGVYNPTCQPPWSEKELWHKVNSANKETGHRGYMIEAATDYPNVDISGILAQLANAGRDEPSPLDTLRPIGITTLMTTNPTMNEPLIHGILRTRETMNVIASPKVGKSFLAMLLAWCVATGRDWLGHRVRRGRVLVLDNELHAETIANRNRVIANAMGIEGGYNEWIQVISLRGKGVSIPSLGRYLRWIKPGDYDLIIVDALYRMLPQGCSENDNTAMMEVYNCLDQYAMEWQAAIAAIHHTTKGDQSSRGVTDVGSGAGSISRAADTHLIIRPHEQDGMAVLEGVTRSWQSPEPQSLRWEYPLWHASEEEPAVKRPHKSATEKREDRDREDCDAIFEMIPVDGVIQRKHLAEQSGCGDSRFTRLMGLLIKADRVEVIRQDPTGGGRQQTFYARKGGEQ